MITVPVELRWLRPEEGGRSAPPPGPRYLTVAKFEILADKWPSEAWSIVAEWDEEQGDQLKTRARMRFLVEGAPEHLLTPGSRFELYEGRRPVACGEVLAAPA